MQLENQILLVVLVLLGVGMIAASVQYFRGRIPLRVLSVTMIGIGGVAIAAVARLVDSKQLYWVGLAAMVVAFYIRGRSKHSNKLGSTREERS